MDLLMMFLGGFISFLSPCVLPMLPIYVVYLAGDVQEDNNKTLIVNTLGFILGYTAVFVALGATATFLGSFLKENQAILKQVAGVAMILVGLQFVGIIKFNFTAKWQVNLKNLKFLGSVIFGMAFAFGGSSCTIGLLGMALVKAGSLETVSQGILYLFVFAMGMAVPFALTSLLFGQAKKIIDALKKHTQTISMASGVFLMVVGVLMMFNVFDKYLSLFQ